MLLMELAPNGTLRQWLDQATPATKSERFHIARGICRGMAALHNTDILHLDLKVRSNLNPTP